MKTVQYKETGIFVIVVLKFFLIKYANADHEPEWVTAPMEDEFRDRYEYTFYNLELSWNAAKQVCANNNSHMLSIKSQRKADLIREFILVSWQQLQDKDYWSGLTEPKQGMYVWDDCDILDKNHDFHNFKEEEYKNDELCYVVRHSPVEWERRKCSDKRYFVCEKVIAGGCNQRSILSSNQVDMYQNKTLDFCKNMCTNTDNCWSGIFTNDGICILLQSRDGAETSFSGVTMFRKSCAEAKYVSQENTPKIDDNAIMPKINCADFTMPAIPDVTTIEPISTAVYDISTSQLTTIESISSAMSGIPSSPCFWYETFNSTHVINETKYETINVTNTENITLTVNWTDTIQVTQTLFFTKSLPIAETYTHTLTSTVIESISTRIVMTSVYITTDIFNITKTMKTTETISSISMIYHSSCTASCVLGNNSYTSPDDPLLLEAVSSIKKELTMDKKATNAYKRKLTSAPDGRRSSQVIGVSGILLIVITLAVIIIGDIPTVLRDCGNIFRRCRSKQSFDVE